MFVNFSVFCDVWHVQSSVLGQNVMFGSVRSSVLLLCDQTTLGTYSLMFSFLFEVRFWAKMWCSESSMFGVFEVQYFGVRSKTKTFWRNVNTYICMPVVSKTWNKSFSPVVCLCKKVQNPKTSICLGKNVFDSLITHSLINKKVNVSVLLLM